MTQPYTAPPNGTTFAVGELFMLVGFGGRFRQIMKVTEMTSDGAWQAKSPDLDEVIGINPGALKTFFTF